MWHNTTYLLGCSLFVLAGAMVFFSGVAWLYQEMVWVHSFLVSSGVTVCFAAAAYLSACRAWSQNQERKGAILFIFLFWIISILFAALPFYFGGISVGLGPSVFEAASGLTTTGATLLSDFEDQTQSVLLWRAFLQWYGGLVSIIFAICFLNALGIVGVGVSKNYLPRGRESNIYHRLIQTVRYIIPLYVGMTGLAVISLLLTGVTPFEALVHAMTSLSTGGFSTKESGLAGFDNLAFKWGILFWCLVGAMNFTLYWALLNWQDAFILDIEVRIILRYSLLVILVLGLFFVFSMLLAQQPVSGHSLMAVIMTTLFALTTAGFVPFEGLDFSIYLLLFLGFIMLIGLSSGSTAGGFKVIRVHYLLQLFRREMVRMPNPHSVKLIQYAGVRVDDRFIRAIWVMFGVYILVLVASILALSLSGLPFEPAFFVVTSALSNTGVYYSGLIDQGAGYTDLSVPMLFILSAVMVAGRLELLVMFALVTREFWRA